MKGIGQGGQVTYIPLPPSLTSSLLTKPSPLFNIPLLSKSKMATAGKAELERGVTKETTRLHYLDLNAKHTTFRFAPRPKIYLQTQSRGQLPQGKLSVAQTCCSKGQTSHLLTDPLTWHVCC